MEEELPKEDATCRRPLDQPIDHLALALHPLVELRFIKEVSLHQVEEELPKEVAGSERF